MKALWKVLAGGVVAAAFVGAAPAAAQYYPNPYGYGNGGNVVGQVIQQVLGGGYTNGYAGGYGYRGVNSQAAVGQCANAVQARLNGNNAYGSNGYGYNGYSAGRVLGVSRVEPRSNGGLTVRGVASSGRYANYGYAQQQQQPPADLTFKCRVDYRGYITNVDIDRATQNYGYNYNQYNPYNQYNQYNQYDPNNPYAAYGYRRY